VVRRPVDGIELERVVPCTDQVVMGTGWHDDPVALLDLMGC
jgi:hypothetical protein